MTDPDSRKGALTAFAAYLVWGFFPLYFKAMEGVSPLEVVAHRIVWATLFTVVAVTVLGRLPAMVAVFVDPRRLLRLAAAAACVGVNWAVYVWSVQNGHALEGGIGYFVCPLCNVLLGMVALRERLTRPQMVALAFVAAGVVVFATGPGLVWLILYFAFSFALYGFIRKIVPVDALVGVAVESVVLLAPALVYLLTRPDGGALMAGDTRLILLLLSLGPVTAIPMAMFAYGARRIRLATLGLMQYVSPTTQTVIAVFVFGEAFNSTQGLALVLIWAGLAVYSWTSLRRAAG